MAGKMAEWEVSLCSKHSIFFKFMFQRFPVSKISNKGLEKGTIHVCKLEVSRFDLSSIFPMGPDLLID